MREVFVTVSGSKESVDVLAEALRDVSSTLTFASVVNMDGVSLLPRDAAWLPRPCREDAGGDDESMAAAWLGDRKLTESVGNQMLQLLPPLELRNKWAFLVFMQDFFSFEAVSLLVPMGYRLVIASKKRQYLAKLAHH